MNNNLQIRIPFNPFYNDVTCKAALVIIIMSFAAALQAQVNRLITKSSPDHLGLSGNLNLISPYPGNTAPNTIFFKSQPGITNFGVLSYTPEIGSRLRAFNFYANGDAFGHSTPIIPDFLIGKDANNETRIGINLLNPQYTLDVSGTINATDILINGSSISNTGTTVHGYKVEQKFFMEA